MKRTEKILPYLALITGILCLSLSSLFVRWAKAPGPVSSLYRMSLATLILLPFFLGKVKKGPELSRSAIPFAILGGLFVAIDHGIWSTALNITRVANATLLNNIAPLWVALIAVIFWKERLGGKFWLGLFLTLSGAVIVFGNDLIHNPHLSVGDLLAIISSLAYAGYFLVTQRGREKLDALSYIWIVDLASAFFLLIGNLAMGNPLSGFDTNTYLAFFGSALISQALGYFSVGYALGHVPASIVAPTMIAQPIITALLAIPLAGEPLAAGQWIGGLTVLAGIYLVNISRSKS
jgi:drug/metabolite transporter (DMT)-like permease